MNKNRLEALSDGVFAIVFTLLVIDIKVPEHLSVGLYPLFSELAKLTPLLVGYFVSFVILSLYWMNHASLYSAFIKNINRQMILLNLLFLSLISLVPFSAHLLGEYYLETSEATTIYGLHILLLSFLSNGIIYYALYSNEIMTDTLSKRLSKQLRIRQGLIPFFTIIGIVVGLFHFPHVAMFCFMFPIAFNIIPGSLDFIEKVLGLDFDK